MHHLFRRAAEAILRPAGTRVAHRWRRALLRTDQAIVRSHILNCTSPRLHLGGGWHRLEGWLNTDIDLVPGVIYLDATKPFPFPDETFGFVYSEHMIEHITRPDAVGMLAECYRVMKRGARIRITTPDLQRIVEVYTEPADATRERYAAWFSTAFLNGDHNNLRTAIINAHFRNWGHQFLWDEASLTESLLKAGFTAVSRQRLRESEFAELRDLENVDRYPDGLLDFESMSLEAVRN